MQIKEKLNIKEMLRFLVGGGSAVLVDLLTYQLMQMLGIDINVAKAVSYVLGAAVGFLINKLWTFESKRFRPMEIVKYCILYACSALINAGTNHLALKVFGIKLLAFLIATGVSTVINFLGQKFFVFRKKEEA